MKGMKKYQAGGMSQGYNARLDDSMGAKNGKKKQSMKSRRDESEGMEKAMGKRKFAGDKAMKFQRGGPMPAGMANRRAGVSGVATPPTGPFPERKEMPTRLGDGQPTDTMDMGPRRPTKATAMRGAAARRSGGSTPRGMKKGGSVRGSGCATKGVRAAKMVTMKGA